MKNFQNYTAEKYHTEAYTKVEEGIYQTKSPYDCLHGEEMIYVTSLTFEMEPECYGEEESSPQDISQIPFEGILDDFSVYVTDFYEELNASSEVLCYQEFGSSYLEDIQKLRTIIGKRYYAVPCMEEDEEEEYWEGVIE